MKKQKTSNVLSRERVVDDFGGEVVGVAEVERRLVVEVFHGVACADWDGVDDLGGIGFYRIGAAVEEVELSSQRRSGEQQGEQQQWQGKEYMSFHFGLQYFEGFFDEGFHTGVGHLLEEFVERLVDGRLTEAQYRQC